jgi:hypothetical protein
VYNLVLSVSPWHHFYYGSRLESIFDKFEPLQSAILAHTATQSELDFAAGEQVRREFFEAFDEIKSFTFNIFRKSIVQRQPRPTKALRRRQIYAYRNCHNFNGNFSEWSSSIQFFNNTVHSLADLALIEKFQYIFT